MDSLFGLDSGFGFSSTNVSFAPTEPAAPVVSAPPLHSLPYLRRRQQDLGKLSCSAMNATEEFMFAGRRKVGTYDRATVLRDPSVLLVIFDRDVDRRVAADTLSFAVSRAIDRRSVLPVGAPNEVFFALRPGQAAGIAASFEPLEDSEVVAMVQGGTPLARQMAASGAVAKEVARAKFVPAPAPAAPAAAPAPATIPGLDIDESCSVPGLDFKPSDAPGLDLAGIPGLDDVPGLALAAAPAPGLAPIPVPLPVPVPIPVPVPVPVPVPATRGRGQRARGRVTETREQQPVSVTRREEVLAKSKNRAPAVLSAKKQNN